MDHCPECGRPYGKRRRCYYCHGRSKTGENRECAQCGASFYVAGWQLADTARNAGRYCSNACKHEAMRVISARPETKFLTQAGYVLVFSPDHPRATNCRVFEHVLVGEKMLGRPLLPNERVHHKDHDKANNDPLNLRVLTNSQHSALHAEEQRADWLAKRPEVQCAECGATFKPKATRVRTTDPRSRAKYCSLSCRVKGVGRQNAERNRLRREAQAAI